MREAEFWEVRDGKVDCRLCPNHCLIADGKRGRCLGRGNLRGRMALYNYGRVVAGNLDPIEKKPLYHFFPGRSILSVGTFGCNLACRFCQNCDISQQEVPGEDLTPAEVVAKATRIRDNIGVAFTYNEPGIWYEFILDCAPLLRQAGLKVVLVTNGYLEPEPWAELCQVTQAMNIDLKAFRDEFYRDVCRGKLPPVLRDIETAVRAGVHVELTNLVIPGLNDDPAEFERLVAWVAALSPDLPLHLSRYFPRFKETAPPTPAATLERFHQIARQRLSYVYVGNLHSDAGQNTLCPGCGAILVERHGYQTTVRLAAPLPRASAGRRPVLESVSGGPVCACGRPVPIKGLGGR